MVMKGRRASGDAHINGREDYQGICLANIGLSEEENCLHFSEEECQYVKQPFD